MKKTLTAILSFFILIVVIYGLWIGVSFFIHLLIASDPKISAAIIGGMTTVFVGLTAVIITQKQIKVREVEEAHRAKKVEIYDKFLKAVTSLVAGSNENVSIEAPSQQELIDYLVEYKRDILLWGSPQVIKCQLEFERVSRLEGDAFLAINDLYKAIRKDIGLSNKGLDNLELVKLYLSDPSELDKLRQSRE